MSTKVLHIITGLGNGGAERVLARLCENIDHDKFETIVVSLRDGGVYGEKLTEIGVKYYYANLKSTGKIRNFIKLYKFVKEQNPDIIQSWLYHADFIGLLLARLTRVKNLVWNIRSTKLNFKNNTWHTVIIRKVCAVFSFIPIKIINCSKVSIEEHIKVGYRPDKFICIPNGYNLDLLYPDPSLALVNDSEPILGFVARNDPQKDIFNFLHALQLLKERNVKFKALVAGFNTDNLDIRNFIKKNQMDNITLLGQRNDILNVYNSVDLLILSSKTEAFPNVVAEAMACGKPCVVTDVGDAAFIVGDTGIVVPPSDYTLLADAIMQMILLGRGKLASKGQLARKRIKQNFSIDKMINSYEQLYLELMNK